MTSNASQSRWWMRRRWRIGLGSLGALLVVVLVAVTSPWPAALLIRGLFEKDGAKTTAEMDRHAPASGLDHKLGVGYGELGGDTSFDWFSPSGSTEALPTVIWIHGGAWISGKKEDVDPYVRILADRGFTGVSLNYPVSPEVSYPVALTQLNAALAFLVAHAAEYRIDPDRIVIAGDSAGAQFTSQLANLVTNPDFARSLGITPGLTTKQLRGVILDCGIYDVSGIPDAPGIGGWGFRVALWSYLGQRDWSATKGAREMSTLTSVTSAFPPTWISGGNDDPLTSSQSVPFASKLRGLGVPTTEFFFSARHTPKLAHEYQFHLDKADARHALESTVAFLTGVTG